MSDYTKTVDFAAKDSLPSGNSGKIIKGTEFETEFDNIATAIATKANLAGPTFTGVLTFASFKGATGATVTTILDEDDMATNSATALATQQSIKAYVDAQQDTVDTLAEILALGNATGGTDIAFGDNDKAIFGAGSDLQIYHDGSNSRILEAGAGFLAIGTNGTDIRLTGNNFSEYMAKFDQDGAATLYYDNSAKIATSSSGISVTGTATMDGLTVEADSNALIRISDSTNTNQRLDLQHNGGVASLISGNNGAYGTIKLQSYNGTDTVDRFKISANGDISFYNDAAAQGLFWDSSASALGIGTTSPASVLDVRGARSDLLRLYSTAAGGNAEIEFLTLNNASSVGKLSKITATQVGADTNGSILAFSTSPTSSNTPETRMTIDSSGNVGIATSSPSSFQAGAENLVIGSGSGDEGMTIHSGTASRGNIYFADGTTGPDLYKGQINYFHDSDYMRFVTVQSERMRIDASGYVGIGSTAPDKLLVVQGASAEVVISDTSNSPLLRFRESGVTKGTIGTSSGDLIFDSGGDTERMRLDASGNLLVGATSVSNSGKVTIDAGATASGLYAVTDATAGYAAAVFERSASNGDIAVFKKGGSAVGSLGVDSNTILQASSASSGGFFVADNGVNKFGFLNGENALRPASDNAITLGKSDRRFVDLYLSGGVVFGATGGNVTSKTLDDYEEGTWTPVMRFAGGSTGITYALQDGQYTKVGRLVTAYIRINLTNNGTDTGLCDITLPFAVGDVMTSTAVQGTSPVGFVTNFSGSYYSLNAHPWEGTSTVRLYQRTSVSGDSDIQVTESEISNTFDCRITVQYMTA